MGEAAYKIPKLNTEHVIRLKAEACRRSLFTFIQMFWNEIIPEDPIWNWHIPFLCSELEKIAHRVQTNEPKDHDLIINIPPGTSKSSTVAVFFPVWCWLRAPWMRFITGSYSSDLSFEHAELSRDLIRSEKFGLFFPTLRIRTDKDQKSNYKATYYDSTERRWKSGGNRYSTSVGGTVTGMHAHIIIVDDPLNPKKAASEAELKTANHWIDQTLSTRKIDKKVTATIMIMQRLAQDDPTGHTLAKKKKNVRHICLPGEIRNYGEYVKPVYLKNHYSDDLLDVSRMDWGVLEEMKADLGQYGYAGQVGQNPVPPGGGMFQVSNFGFMNMLPGPNRLGRRVRAWDKAGSKDSGAYTAGVKMTRFDNAEYLIEHVVRGQWRADEREKIIRQTAELDGPEVEIYLEQEPGSSGKESVENSITNLAGFRAYADRPTGDKVYRADPYSVQVNNGNVYLMRGDWNHDFIEEHRYFPFSTFKDQVDAASMCFAKLTGVKKAGTW